MWGLSGCIPCSCFYQQILQEVDLRGLGVASSNLPPQPVSLLLRPSKWTSQKNKNHPGPLGQIQLLPGAATGAQMLHPSLSVTATGVTTGVS